MEHFNVVIVGAGHGGTQAATALRQGGFSGSICLIGEEPELPYERPPLSKDYLAGAKAFDALLMRPPGFWQERRISTWVGRRVMSLDVSARTLTLSDGAQVAYEKLIWAAGGHPRRLTCAGHDLRGIHYVRTRADVDRLKGELVTAQRAVVIGGGYIGLEVAAVLNQSGKSVVLLEALERVLARVTGRSLSAFYEAEHRARGVDLRTGVAVERILGRDGRAFAVELSDGSVVECDLVIAGIGILPSDAPLREAGADARNGLLVDEQCRTTLEHVYALGDCAAHVNRFAGGATIRLESVQNATDQALVVAKSILGLPARYEAVPWFWSNQFDLRLQTVGLLSGYDLEVVRGNPATRSFSVVYLRQGTVVALDCVNATRDYVQGRRLVVEGSKPSRERLADPMLPLRDL